MTDPIRFEQWYRAEHPRVATAVAVAFGSTELGQEAADEAVARAWERWDRVSTMDSPTGWLYRVAFNVAKRRCRRAAAEQRLLRRSRTPDSVAGPAGELWLLVGDLPARQRQAVVLRHVGHLQEAEIADAMGITRGTVSSTLRSAYESLRSALNDPLVEEVR